LNTSDMKRSIRFCKNRNKNDYKITADYKTI
jgi:hypothetical protein